MRDCMSVIKSSLTKEPQGPEGAGEVLGRELVSNLKAQKNPEFKPKLFILFATPDFLDFERLVIDLRAVLEGDDDCRDVPLLGCSAAACLVDYKIEESAVLLVALCSDGDAVRVRTAVGANAIDDPESAVAEIAKGLGLPEQGGWNHKGNELALLFLPGFKQLKKGPVAYEDPQFHRLFCERTGYQLPTFGGSCAGLQGEHDLGWQFHNFDVLQETAVVALIECDARFGQAMSTNVSELDGFVTVVPPSGSKQGGKGMHGRQPIEEFMLDDGTRVPACEFVREKEDELGTGHRLVFGERQVHRESTIYFPFLDQKAGTVSFFRRLDKHRRLEMLRTDDGKLRDTFEYIWSTASQRADISDATTELAGCLAIVCAGHLAAYRENPKVSDRILAEVHLRCGEVPLVGAYLNGECGADRTGRPSHNNLCMGTLMLGKRLSRSACNRFLSRCLANAGNAMLEAKSVEETVSAALAGLEAAGFRGGMVSLLYGQGGSGANTEGPGFLVAQGARGDDWKKIVDKSRCPLDGDDILAYVANAHQGVFIPDAGSIPEGAPYHCDDEAVKTAGVISMYVAPLISDKRLCIGAVQFDLGDASKLKAPGTDLKLFLDAYAKQVGGALARAMLDERTKLSRELDRAIANAMACHTAEDACETFINLLIKATGVDDGHIRIVTGNDEEEKRLDLVAGKGLYATEALIHGRKSLALDDRGPSATCFRDYALGTAMVVNDADRDKRVRGLLKQMNLSSSLEETIRRHKAFANCVIADPSSGRRIGVLTLAAHDTCRFPPHLVAALEDVGARLALLTSSFEWRKKVSDLTRDVHPGLRERDLGFLSAATPESLGTVTDEALQILAGRLAMACGAEIVSILRWDEENSVLRLAAAKGWHQNMVGKAVYARGEHMTGRLIDSDGILVLPDRHKDKNTPEKSTKYQAEMLGKLPVGETIEVIAFRLHAYNKPLGVVVMHNRIPPGTTEASLFSTTNQRVLKQMQTSLSNYVYSLRARDRLEWENQAQKCLTEIGRDLLQPGKPAEILNLALEGIRRRRDLESIAVLRYDDKRKELVLWTSLGHPSALTDPPARFTDGSLGFRAFATGMPVCERQQEGMPPIDLLHREEFEKHLKSGRVSSYLALPLYAFGEKLGVMSFINIRSRGSSSQPTFFTRQDVQFFERVAEHMGLFLWQVQSSEREEELRRCRREAEKLLTSIGAAFSEGMHPMTKPLHKIGELCDKLCREHPKSQLLEHLSTIRQHAAEGTRRTERFRKHVQRASQREVHEWSLWSIVSKTVASFRESCEEKGIDLQTRCGKDVVASVNEQEISDILENVIENAIDAMPNGGTLVAELAFSETEGEALIAVTDDGCGMTNEILETLGEAFLTTKPDGTGMGIFLAKAMARHNGGDLEITSTPGKGTTVTLRLPRVHKS